MLKKRLKSIPISKNWYCWNVFILTLVLVLYAFAATELPALEILDEQISKNPKGEAEFVHFANRYIMFTAAAQAFATLLLVVVNVKLIIEFFRLHKPVLYVGWILITLLGLLLSFAQLGFSAVRYAMFNQKDYGSLFFFFTNNNVSAFVFYAFVCFSVGMYLITTCMGRIRIAGVLLMLLVIFYGFVPLVVTMTPPVLTAVISFIPYAILTIGMMAFFSRSRTSECQLSQTD